MQPGTFEENPWLVFLRRNPEAVLRLFCFHYAGGSASAFRNWVNYLPGSIEVIAIQLPGREGRFKEAHIQQFDKLIDVLVLSMLPYLDLPYVVFGHSLGSLKSFEWIRAIKKRKLQQPNLYIAAGRGAPQLPRREPPIAFLPEEEFVQELIKNYGEKLEPILKVKELRDLFIPQIRADYLLSETYEYKEGIKLDCPIFAFAGDEENKISEGDLHGWAAHTTNNFRARRFPGDHFFIHSAEEQVLTVINNELSAILNSVCGVIKC